MLRCVCVRAQVFAEQPSVQQTISILRGLRKRYEGYHGACRGSVHAGLIPKARSRKAMLYFRAELPVQGLWEKPAKTPSRQTLLYRFFFFAHVHAYMLLQLAVKGEVQETHSHLTSAPTSTQAHVHVCMHTQTCNRRHRHF